MIALIFFHGLIHMLDTCSLAGLHIDLDFSLLPYFDYLVIFFPTHCFTLDIYVLCVQVTSIRIPYWIWMHHLILCM